MNSFSGFVAATGKESHGKQNEKPVVLFHDHFSPNLIANSNVRICTNPEAMRIVIASIFIAALMSGCTVKPEIPPYLSDYQEEFLENPREANMHWFKDAGYGMFIHYGLYCLLEKGEWVQLRDTIPVAEYAKLKEASRRKFRSGFDLRSAIRAGMKYITITSKHHDGFCLLRQKQPNSMR